MCTNGGLEEVKLYFVRKAKLLMQFIVHPEIFERFPSMRLPVVVAHNLDNPAALTKINFVIKLILID